jgi:hypothetical protein
VLLDGLTCDGEKKHTVYMRNQRHAERGLLRMCLLGFYTADTSGVPLKTKLSERGYLFPDFLLQKGGCLHHNVACVSGRLPVPAFHPDDRLSRTFMPIV